MRQFIRLFLNLVGSFGLGVFLHEVYHYFMFDRVESVCLEFGGSAIAYVQGFGRVDEVTAYVITVVVFILGFIFSIYDLIKE